MLIESVSGWVVSCWSVSSVDSDGAAPLPKVNTNERFKMGIDAYYNGGNNCENQEIPPFQSGGIFFVMRVGTAQMKAYVEPYHTMVPKCVLKDWIERLTKAIENEDDQKPKPTSQVP